MIGKRFIALYTLLVLVIGLSSFAVNVCADAPEMAVLVEPVNNSVVDSVDVSLCVYVEDGDGGALTVSFYNESGVLIDSITSLSGKSVCTVWRNRTPGTSYSWYANVSDGVDTVQGDMYVFLVGDEIVSGGVDILYAGLFLLGIMVVAAEYRFSKSGAGGLFAVVAGICFMLVFVVDGYEWMRAVFMALIFVYIYRWVSSKGGA